MMTKYLAVNPEESRLQFAISTAHKAGILALKYFNDLASLAVEKKSNAHDVVSIADRETEILMRELIKSEFPNDGILGEELGFDDTDSDYIWVIDPIDGTQMFLSGIPTWSISIAIVSKGEPIIGVVYDPNQGDCYSGLIGNGAYLNNQKMEINNQLTLSDGMTGVGTNRFGSQEPVVSTIDYILGNGGQVIRNGSGALMLAQVAASKLVAYFEPRMFPWDCLAGICLIKESRGYACDFELNDYTIKHGARVLAGTKSSVFDLKSQIK